MHGLRCLLRDQRGQGRAIVVFIVLAAFVGYGVFKFLGPYQKHGTLQKTVELEAGQGGVKSDEQIRKAILDEAKRLGLNISAKAVSLDRGEEYLTIDVAYSQPVRLPLYTYLWNFRAHARARIQTIMNYEAVPL